MLKFKWIKKYIKSNMFLYNILFKIYYWKWTIRKFTRYRIIDREYSRNNIHLFSYHEYGESSKVSFQSPQLIDNYIMNEINFYVGKTYNIPKSFFNVFQNVNLVGPEAVGVTFNNEIILETVNGNIGLLNKCSPSQFNNPNKLEIDDKLDCAVSLVTPYNNSKRKNYLHWMTEGLLLLEAVEYYSSKYGIKPKIIINNNPTDYQIDSLNMLGYLDNDIIKWKYKRVKVSNLIVPALRSIMNDWHKIISPGAINWLRNKLLKNCYDNYELKGFSDRVFISRDKPYDRKVLNIHEISYLLNEFGFKEYFLEKMKFKDQIFLFNNARTIIGAHGAGLANIMFSSMTDVIELFGKPPERYTEYYRIANSLGLNYNFVKCQHSFENYHNEPYHTYRKHDLIVNPHQLQITLESLS